jgi:large subunit ribosomal protein L21
MYAIIKTQGQQFRVSPGMEVEMNLVAANPGETITLTDSVLMVNKDGTLTIGTPIVGGATVELEVKEHFRGEKLTIFKFKRRHRHHRKTGHRQELSRVVVKAINV